jgi:hypothetical protein
MQFKKRFFPLDGALIGLALLLSLQITRADPYIQIRLFNEIWWDDVGGEEKDYCQTAIRLSGDGCPLIV